MPLYHSAKPPHFPKVCLVVVLSIPILVSNVIIPHCDYHNHLCHYLCHHYPTTHSQFPSPPPFVIHSQTHPFHIQFLSSPHQSTPNHYHLPSYTFSLSSFHPHHYQPPIFDSITNCAHFHSLPAFSHHNKSPLNRSL